MKPLGVSHDMRLIRPTPAQDAIWDAVEAAIAAGMSARDFRREAAEAWRHELREQEKVALAALREVPDA